MTKLYNYLTIAIIGEYIIYLYSIKKLNFLIHERYIIFTLLAGIVLLIVGLIGVSITFKIKNKKIQFNLSLVILIVSILVPFIQLKSLSSESFNIRSANSKVKIADNEKQDIRQKINFRIDTNEFTIYDWIKAKGLDDLSIFKEKEFTGTGFITPKPGSMFILSRFIVSCCIVDATPIGILVDYDYTKEYKANDWLEVRGKFKIQDVNGIMEPVIVPTSVIKINTPDNVYLNRN